MRHCKFIQRFISLLYIQFTQHLSGYFSALSRGKDNEVLCNLYHFTSSILLENRGGSGAAHVIVLVWLGRLTSTFILLFVAQLKML